MSPIMQAAFTILAGWAGAWAISTSPINFWIGSLPAPGTECGTQHQPRQCDPSLAVFASRAFALTLYLAYPVQTLRLSLTDRRLDGAFVGLENYTRMADDPKFWRRCAIISVAVDQGPRIHRFWLVTA